MDQYRKRPVVIEAVQWNGDNFAELLDWGCPATILPATDTQSLIIGTLEDGPNCEAVHVATMGDWIIKGVKGECYPCKPDIFEATYDRVEQFAGIPAAAIPGTIPGHFLPTEYYRSLE